MKILAIDTSSKICGVCILDEKVEIYREDIVTERSHSIKLMPVIEKVFDKTNLTINDIDLIVCDKGPGSFTGIRIGVATAKAFSDSLGIPVTGVSSLETLAYEYINGDYTVCSVLDAKHNNCYFALYKLSSNFCETLIPPTAQSLENMIELVKPYENVIFVGDGVETFKRQISNSIPNAYFSESNLLNSYNLGRAGYDKYINQVLESPLPLYLKVPQAQKLMEERLNGSSNS